MTPTALSHGTDRLRPAPSSPARQYEMFPEVAGWRWRLIERSGRVLACAPRPLTRERCLTAVRILQMSEEAPLLVRPGALPGG